MDTRDQTLTKLTRLHGKSHQPITVQQAYDAITHARWWASWNWWWRMVDDDDGDGFPSPEPRTDSRSALPREIRAWRRLRIVKRDESFSLIFSPRTWIYRVGVEVGGAPGGPRGRGRAQGGRRAPTLVDRVWAPWCWFFRQYFSLIPKRVSVDFQVISRTFISAQK